MPNYEFECAACGHHFELLLKVDERDKPQKCPQCGGEKAKRLPGGFTVPRHRGVHFKVQVERGKVTSKYYPKAKPKYPK